MQATIDGCLQSEGGVDFEHLEREFFYFFVEQMCTDADEGKAVKFIRDCAS